MPMNQFGALYGQFFCCSCPGGINSPRCGNVTGVVVTSPLFGGNSKYAWGAGVLGFLLVFTLSLCGAIYITRHKR